MFDQIIQDLTDKGWSYRSPLLNSQDLKDLNEFFDAHKSRFEAAKVGSEKVHEPKIRGDHTFWIDPLNPEPPLKQLLALLDHLKSELNQHLFLGLKDYECHLAYYPVGYFYQKHLDTFEKGSTRVLSFVFYLNEVWSPGFGGQLVLYDRDGKELASLSPQPGAAVFFLSQDFPHEVKPSLRERRSFTGWIHHKILY